MREETLMKQLEEKDKQIDQLQLKIKEQEAAIANLKTQVAVKIPEQGPELLEFINAEYPVEIENWLR